MSLCYFNDKTHSVKLHLYSLISCSSILPCGGTYESRTRLKGFADLRVTAPPTRHLKVLYQTAPQLHHIKSPNILVPYDRLDADPNFWLVWVISHTSNKTPPVMQILTKATFI